MELWLDLTYKLDQMDQTDIQKPSIQQQQNTHSFYMHMEHSPG